MNDASHTGERHQQETQRGTTVMSAFGKIFGRKKIKGEPEQDMVDSSSLSFTGKTANWSARNRWWVISASLAVLVAAIVVGGMVTPKILDDDGGEGESALADKLFDERFKSDTPQPATEQLVFSNPSLDASDPRFQATVDELVNTLRALPEVVQVVTYYDTQSPEMLSQDSHVVLGRVVIAGDPDDAREKINAIVEPIYAADDATADYEIGIVGNASLNEEIDEIVDKGFQNIFLVTIVLGLTILIIAFRALVTAVVPLTLAVGSIMIATTVAAVVSQSYSLADAYTEMIMLMGMAVGIDYSLFIVSRYRSERMQGRSKLDAISIASNTTGRAVFYAGTTVVLSLAGLMVTNNPIFISLSLGAIIVVVIAIVASLTLLPAMLGVLGDNVNRLRLPILGRSIMRESDGGIWSAVSDRVLARPAIFAAVAVAGLIALALPVTSLNLGFNQDASGIPAEATGRRTIEILEEHFTAGLNRPALVVVDARSQDSDSIQTAVDTMIANLEREDAYFAPFEPIYNEAGDALFVRVPLAGEIESDTAHDAVRQLRTEIIPAAFAGIDADVYVTGATAGSQDFQQWMAGRAPLVFAFVLGLAFILLLVMFRSIVIPFKAIALNLLSVGAAYGVLVAVFQWGWGASIIDAEVTGIIEAWIPLFLFGILFGLSMDYHMLLLNRIKESHDQGATNEESVSTGIKLTAGQITSAAAIMVGVFGAFALGPIVGLQQFGLGLGVAVLIDATIIRSILLPATMKLLGEWNWYLPSWLEWLPNVSAEGNDVEEPVIELPSAEPAGHPAYATIPADGD